MAKIPLGNFGNAIAEWAPPRSRIPAESVGAGIQALGRTAMDIGVSMLEEQRRIERQAQQVAALGEVETGIADAADVTIRGITDGSIDLDQAEKHYVGESEVRIGESISKVDRSLQALVRADAKNVQVRRLGNVRDAMLRQSQLNTRASLNDAIEQRQRLALTDREKATGEAIRILADLGPKAGMSPVDIQREAQSFRERVAYAAGTNMVTAAQSSIETIEAASNRLAGPEFADLDPQRREALNATLISHRIRLENRIQHNADRREAKADVTLSEVDKQLASGVPVTPEMWGAWAADVRGTRREADFNQRIKDETTIQDVLRLPVEQQKSWIQEREANLMTQGGTVRDKANLDRLKSAIDANVKQLQEAPLLFAQNRSGQPVKPFDVEALVDPTRAGETAKLFADRVANVGALRTQYGPSVKARVLMPHEASLLTLAMGRMAPDQQVEVFRTLRTAIGDDSAYRDSLAQIAPDSPVKAMAGIIAARGVDYRKSGGMFAPDETIKARQTAILALTGESLLNPTKAMKGQDGSQRSFVMPQKADMLDRFHDSVGNAFAGTPEAMDMQFELVQATYVGLIASRGGAKNANITDSALFQEAIDRTTPVMRQGGVSFLKPVVGMSDDQFREKLRAALPEALKSQYDSLPLRNLPGNRYVISNGSRPLVDATGAPIIVEVKP